MQLLQQYTWSVAKRLVKENHFSMIHNKDKRIIDQANPVLHFIKNTKTTLVYIRLVSVDYIWPNHLVQDMEAALESANLMKIQANVKKMKFLNLYLFPQSPSQEIYQIISNTANNGMSNQLEVHMGFVDLEKEQLGIPSDTFDNFPVSKESFLYYFSNPVFEEPKQILDEIMETENKREEDVRKIFNYGKTILSYLFIAINTVLFLLMTFAGGSTNIEVLYYYGAKEAFSIANGEYWRLITPIFLHIGFLHFALNNLAIYYLGKVTEKIYGSVRFFSIYLIAGIIGNIASFLFLPSNIAAGASGAIFGLFGALLYFGYIYPDLFFRTLGRDVLTIIGINLVFGIVVPNIDNFAHIGGLIGGFIVASIVHLPKQKNKKWAISLLSSLLIIGILFITWWGIEEREVVGNPIAINIRGEDALDNGEIEEAQRIFAHLVKYYPNYVPYHIDFAETALQIGNTTLARQQYKLVIALEPNNSQAYYKLALIAHFEKNDDEARRYLSIALELDPNLNDEQHLVEQLY